MTRHAWLQKHPSPLAGGSEFHWYPDAPSAGDRGLRVGFVERMRGIEPPAVLWQLERGRVAWGQVFSATAPLDGRRYVGLVLSVVERDLPVADLLAGLTPPPAAPWTAAIATRACGRGLGRRERPFVTHAADGDVAGVVRALLSGGSASVDDPSSAELPPWIASIERVLPEPGATPRLGVWCAGSARGSRDRVAELAAAAWRDPVSRAARAWTLLCELALVRGESVDRTGVALEVIDAGAVLTAAERAGLDGGGSVVEVLHAWGRGRFDASPDADTLAPRLADLVASRVIARLAAGDSASGAFAEARWYALLPATRRKALLAAVARRTASLRVLVEAHHA
jgi:hypothetical protein